MGQFYPTSFQLPGLFLLNIYGIKFFHSRFSLFPEKIQFRSQVIRFFFSITIYDAHLIAYFSSATDWPTDENRLEVPYFSCQIIELTKCPTGKKFRNNFSWLTVRLAKYPGVNTSRSTLPFGKLSSWQFVG